VATFASSFGELVYFGPRLFGTLSGVDVPQCHHALSYDGTSDLFGYCCGLLYSTTSHESIFTPQLCFDGWRNEIWVCGCDSDHPLWIKAVQQAQQCHVELVKVRLNAVAGITYVSCVLLLFPVSKWS